MTRCWQSRHICRRGCPSQRMSVDPGNSPPPLAQGSPAELSEPTQPTGIKINIILTQCCKKYSIFKGVKPYSQNKINFHNHYRQTFVARDRTND